MAVPPQNLPSLLIAGTCNLVVKFSTISKTFTWPCSLQACTPTTSASTGTLLFLLPNPLNFRVDSFTILMGKNTV